MAKKDKSNGGSSGGGGRDGFSAIAFFVFIITACVWLTQAVLNVANENVGKIASIVGNIQYIVTILLFLLVALLAHQYVRPMKKGWKLLYWLAFLLLAAAYVLPYVF